VERVDLAVGSDYTAHAGAARGGVPRAVLCAFLLLPFPAAPAEFTPPAQLVVVTDDNYPPYLFRAGDGQLQGILVDKWALWSRTTGVPVKVEGLAWSDAQQRVKAGSADVIDALAYTAERAGLYEFSRSYATVEARVFFHRTISGINQVPSLRGFTIGAKEGSACARWLQQRGIDTIRTFPASEALVQAAGAGEIRLFCMDSPTAQYFLFKHALAADFRQTAPLYGASFHWAVAGGRAELRNFIQSGYDRTPAQALSDIDARWLGSPVSLPIEPRYLYYLAAFAMALFAAGTLLFLWNRTLRTRVEAGTAEASGQKQVLEMIAAGSPLSVTLDALVRFIEARSQGMLGSILLLDGDGTHVQRGAAPNLPESYSRAIDGEPIGPRAGSCGTAAFRGEQVITEDIATDSLWESYRPLAMKHGLRACWSTPIFDPKRRVLGTFAMYFREPRRPGPEDLRLIEMASHTAAIAIVKRREEDALRESEARLRLSVHASNIGLWDWNIPDDRLYLSPEWKSQLGYQDDEIDHHYREWESRLHPDDRERVVPKVRAYLAAPGPSYEIEFRLRHKDGSYRWIYARAQVELDTSGNPRRMLGCHIDVTDRKRAEEELQQSFSRLQELSRRLVEVQEVERRNINRELHDRVGQNLSALNLSLNLIRAQLPPNAPAAIAARLSDAQELVESAVRHVRDVMADLRPPALDDYGLLAALRTHADALSGRLGVPVVVTGQEPEPRLSPATETALFRIAQEALNNVSKHARAANVHVRLAAVNGVVELSVSDDGVGFDAGASSPERATWGLKTMRERAEAVGATLRIEPAPSGGTRVVVEAERSEA